MALDTLTLRRALRAPARPIRVGETTLELLDEWQPALLTAVAATCIVSVFISELLLALAGLMFLVRLAAGRTKFPSLAINVPIIAFGVWTVLSASFSDDPVGAHQAAKKLVLFAVLWIAVDSLGKRAQRERLVDAALLGTVVLGIGCIVQYYLLGFDTLNQRPIGFLGHYMTAAGLSMAGIVLAVARLVFWRSEDTRPGRRDWLAIGIVGLCMGAIALVGHFDLVSTQAQRGVLACGLTVAGIGLARGSWGGRGMSALLAMLAAPICAWSLLVSQTRSAWLGTLVGLAIVFFLWAPRMLLLLPAGVLVILAVGPKPVLDRLTITDDSSRDRYYMWQAGIDMIAERPIFGVGPGQVEPVYSRYRWQAAPNASAPHLHDNAVQIAAERGLPGLALWIWMVFVAMKDALDQARLGRRGPGWVAVAALASWVAVMAGGLFEYNFGDSEIFILLLLITALPYGLRREREAAPT